MGTIESEINALKQKQNRLEKKQKKENEEVWRRIEILEKIALEGSGVDAGGISQNVLIALTKSMQRRGLKYLPKKLPI